MNSKRIRLWLLRLFKLWQNIIIHDFTLRELHINTINNIKIYLLLLMSTQTEPEIITEQFQNQNGRSNWTFLMIFWHTFSRTEFDRSRPLAASSEGSSGSIRACSVLEKSIGLSSLSNIPNETKTEQKQCQFRPCQCLKLHVTSAWTTAWCVCVCTGVNGSVHLWYSM